MTVTDEIEGLGDPAAPVKLAKGVDLSTAVLSVQEGFVLSRVDGVSSAQTICLLTGLGEATTFEILRRLRAQGLIVVGDEAPVKSEVSATGGALVGESIRTKPGPDLAEEEQEPPEDAEVELPLERRREIRAIFRQLGDLNFFELLGVDDDADPKAIRRAYFKRSKQYHPDRYYTKKLGRYQAMLAEIFKQVAAANKFLGDAERRQAYRAMVKQEKAQEALARQLELQTEQVLKAAQEEFGGEYAVVRSKATRRRDRIAGHYTGSYPGLSSRTGAGSSPSSDRLAAARSGGDTTSSSSVPAAGDRGQVNTGRYRVVRPSSASYPAVSPTADGQRPRASSEHRAVTSGERRAVISGEQRAVTSGEQRAVTSGEQRAVTSGEQRAVTSGEQRAVTSGEQRAVTSGERRAVTSGEQRTADDAQQTRRAVDRERRRRMSTAVNPVGARVQRAREFFERGKQQLAAGKSLAAAASLKLAMTFDPSEQEYRRLHEQAVDDSRDQTAEGYFKRAIFEESVGRYETAGRLYVKAADVSPKSLYQRRAAQAMLWAEDLIKAKEYATNAVQNDPNSAEARLVLARVYVAAGLKKNARRETEMALKLDPASAEAKQVLKEIKRV